jgi:hypothetical protein
MFNLQLPRVVYVEVLDGDAIVLFEDGRSLLYPALLLDKCASEAIPIDAPIIVE